MKSKIIILLTLCLFSLNSSAQNKISVNTNKVISEYNRAMLLGTNAGVFYEESSLMNLNFLENLRALNPGIIRMPGGTWSNELYWNGNRVRIVEENFIEGEDWRAALKAGKNPIEVGFDMSKYKNEKWDVDYSGYSPGFRINDYAHTLSDFHGFTDVLFLHKFIQAFGAETMVSVNMGTGTVKMAVEWVKFTKQRQKYARAPFNVKYWEMGNEMDGDWEISYKLPDGSVMTAKEYVRRYKLFAPAMKKADPTIKVGGSVASSMSLKFIEELIMDLDAPIDFISFHAYPSKDSDTDFVTMANHAAEVNDAVKRIKGWLKKYRPEDKDRIEIALTEWNIKVKEDITTVDLTNTLWSAVMLGEIAKSGLDIAIQWDLFSTTKTGGHGLFNPKDENATPRSQYWASYLWNHYMGNTMVETTLETPDYVRAYTTVENGKTALMIINGSKEESVNIQLNLSNTKNKIKVEEITYSNQNFVLNTDTLIPTKSEKPTVKQTCIKKKKGIDVAPYSIKIIRY